MAFNADAVIIPGRGTVLVADPDTAFPDYKTVDPAGEIEGGWVCLGHTSRENMVEISVEGGELTTKGSWWSPNLRSARSPRIFGGKVNALQMDKATMELAFPGGKHDQGKSSFAVPSIARDVLKSLFILAEDQTGQRMAVGLYRASVSLGDAPSFDVENFFEIQLSWSTLDSTKTPGFSQEWFHPALAS